MEAIKLNGMGIVQDLGTEEEFLTLKDFLLTDPKDISHEIEFWRKELTNASVDDKPGIEDLIAKLLTHKMNQAKLTMAIYSFDKSETKEVVKTKNESKVVEAVVDAETSIVEDKPTEEKANPETDPSKQHLHVVTDKQEANQDVKTLREKYASLIKEITMDDLKVKVKELLSKDETKAEGVELASFILSGGLYKAKNAKKFNNTKVERFIAELQPTEAAVNTPVEEVNVGGSDKANDEAPAADEDLYKKYAHYLGDNKMSLGGLKAEAKFLLSSDETQEKGLEVIAFILSTGEYVDDKPEKWTSAAIEKFIIDLREDIKVNPLTIENAPTSKIEDKPKEEEVVDYDVKLGVLYGLVEKEILEKDLTFDDIKKFISDYVKANKVQNLVGFYGIEEDAEKTKIMYDRFFVGYVDQTFKKKDVMKINVTTEIIPLINKVVEDKEESLVQVIKQARDLYKQRGENVNLSECRTIVYKLAIELHPEYFNKFITLAEDKPATETKVVKEETPVIITDKANFEEKHPEIWDKVKDINILNDVYTIARELENSNSFLVVSEMIIHLISSGNIKENAEATESLKWDNSQIEEWINKAFALPEESNEGNPLDSAQDTVAAPEVAAVTENGVTEEVTQPVTDPVVESPSANSVQEVTVEVPDGITISEEDAPYKGLFGAKKQDFWQGLANTILFFQNEGKDKKEITHLLADKIKALAQRDDIKGVCHVRNFKKSKIDELYSTVNKIADTLKVPGWEIIPA